MNTYEDQIFYAKQILGRRAKAHEQQRKFFKFIYLIKEKKVVEKLLQNHKNEEEKIFLRLDFGHFFWLYAFCKYLYLNLIVLFFSTT